MKSFPTVAEITNEQESASISSKENKLIHIMSEISSANSRLIGLLTRLPSCEIVEEAYVTCNFRSLVAQYQCELLLGQIKSMGSSQNPNQSSFHLPPAPPAPFPSQRNHLSSHLIPPQPVPNFLSPHTSSIKPHTATASRHIRSMSSAIDYASNSHTTASLAVEYSTTISNIYNSMVEIISVCDPGSNHRLPKMMPIKARDCLDRADLELSGSLAKIQKALFDSGKMQEFIRELGRRNKQRKETTSKMARALRELSIKFANINSRLDTISAAVKQCSTLESCIDSMASEMQEREVVARNMIDLKHSK
jgi:hypothetical protein